MRRSSRGCFTHHAARHREKLALSPTRHEGLGATLADALRLAAEVETLAAQYWHAVQVGQPVVLDGGELARVRARLADYGQRRPGR